MSGFGRKLKRNKQKNEGSLQSKKAFKRFINGEDSRESKAMKNSK